nr:hypothetical protein [Candidatus Sumerlaeota bacterium]
RNAEEAVEIVKLIEELLHAAPTLRLQFLRYEDYTLYANSPFTYAFDPFSSPMLADGKGWRYEAAEETHGWHVQLSYGGYSSSFLRPDYQITTASNDRLVGLRRWITDAREWNLRQGPKVSGGIRQ